MKYLPENLRYILPKIKNAHLILLFLDYDGTLTPIVKRPEDAVLREETRALLKGLLKNRRIRISIVSGRALSHIKKLIGLDNIYYAGNHGLEAGVNKKSYIIPEAGKHLIRLKEVKSVLSKALKPIGGVEIEEKGLSLSIHYRGIRQDRLPELKRLFSAAVRCYIKSKHIRVTRGKKVFEIRPPVDWDKGRYCLSLLEKLSRTRRKILPIYLGDDRTDEDAFKALKETGITVLVKGERKYSRAEYYVESIDEALDFLRCLLAI